MLQQTLQNFYLKLGFDKVPYYSVNQALNDQYILAVNSIKTFLDERDKKDLLCISFDETRLYIRLYIKDPKI